MVRSCQNARVTSDWHFEDFTEASYRDIVAAAQARYTFEPFGTKATGPHVLWRHDVDYSVHRATGVEHLAAVVRNRLKRLQYRPGTLDGFIAGTGLTLDDPTSP